MSEGQQQPPGGADFDSESATLQVASSGPSVSRVDPPSTLPAPGSVLAGRYTVLELLGQGGMGVVLAAYDSRLDRRVALKLLRPQEGDSSAEDAQARMVREAQAMARLNHPHVVHVYDAGTLEGGSVFISMEYVQGVNLRGWLRQQQRSWREVLSAYAAAGRGLAAAHAAGLVHRDFKPDNVLVGEDGRVRVTDFGVARADNNPAASTPGSAEALNSDTWDKALTLPGKVIGTPKYMAPELFQGQVADARSDLYAFCISLYEALYGQPPFTGISPTARFQARREGRITPPPADSPVPAWVARAVLQGLAANPYQRPASMEALLAVLENDPQARRRARLQAALVAGSMAVLAGVAVAGWVRSQGSPAGCGSMERRLAGVWDGTVRQQVQAALRGTGAAYAADTAERVSTGLEDYAARWVRMSAEVCEAAGGTVAQAQGLLARKEYCLERRRSQLRALTELLARGPDQELLPRAVQAVQALPPLEYCTDERALTAAVPPPEEPSVRAKAEALQQQVDRLEALSEAGKYKDALALSEELQAQAQALGYAPLHARVLYILARLKERTGDYKDAEELARQAMLQAARGKDSVLLARAASVLSTVVGWRQGRYPEALALTPALEATMELADEERTRATVLAEQGNLLRAMGKYEEAREKTERAVAILEKLLGPRHLELATRLSDLGNVYWSMGRNELAEPQYRRALDIRQKALGPEHPAVASSLNNLGNAVVNQGRLEEGRALYEQALTLRQKALGPEHPEVADSLNNMGVISDELGRYEEALGYYSRTLALREKVLGPEHPRVAESLFNLGLALDRLERHTEAHGYLQRALAGWEKALGPEHPYVADAASALGNNLSLRKQWDESLRYLQRALAIQEKALGPEHPDLVSTLVGLGQLQRARGRPGLARPLVERALAIVPARQRAEVQLELAQVLWESNQDRKRALELAAQAREYWQQSGNTAQADRVSQWLAARPAR